MTDGTVGADRDECALVAVVDSGVCTAEAGAEGVLLEVGNLGELDSPCKG